MTVETFSFANPGLENNATPVNDSVHSTTIFLKHIIMPLLIFLSRHPRA
jgi:hypothetical protein